MSFLGAVLVGSPKGSKLTRRYRSGLGLIGYFAPIVWANRHKIRSLADSGLKRAQSKLQKGKEAVKADVPPSHEPPQEEKQQEQPGEQQPPQAGNPEQAA